MKCWIILFRYQYQMLEYLYLHAVHAANRVRLPLALRVTTPMKLQDIKMITHSKSMYFATRHIYKNKICTYQATNTVGPLSVHTFWQIKQMWTTPIKTGLSRNSHVTKLWGIFGNLLFLDRDFPCLLSRGVWLHPGGAGNDYLNLNFRQNFP